MAQNGYGGLENGILRISHEEDKSAKWQEKVGPGMQQRRRNVNKKPATTKSNPPTMVQKHPTYVQRTPRAQNQMSSGGPGMQAVFLGPSARSKGTGVFLPKRPGVDFHYNKPALSPVLLPSRVVQTLNLNVHQIGQNIKKSPAVQPKNATNNKDAANKKLDDVYCSPEIFLPKEWTY